MCLGGGGGGKEEEKKKKQREMIIERDRWIKNNSSAWVNGL